MTKQMITDRLTESYNSFIDLINSLSTEEYANSYHGKWTAGQQLEHIILCVKPLVYVFSMDKQVIAKTFGTTDRPARGYDSLLTEYRAKLKEGGKAPERFLPAAVTFDQREAQCATLRKLIGELCTKITTFSDSELDTLLIPHPLLGNLTLREMLYNAIYHVQHHQAQTEEHLRSK